MQKTTKINRGIEKDFESKDTINRLLAKKLRFPYSEPKNYGLKRITFTNDKTCTCAKWKKERKGHLKFSYHFSFRIQVEKHNQKILLKIVSKFQQNFLVVICVFDNTPNKFLENVDVRITWKICVQ